MGLTLTMEAVFSGSCAKTKWQYLRDTYRRELAKLDQPTGSAYCTDSKWKYFQQMTFLHDVYPARRMVSSVTGPHNSEEDSPAVTEESQCQSDFEVSNEQISSDHEAFSLLNEELERPKAKKPFKSPKKRLRQRKDIITDLVELEKVKVSHLEEFRRKKENIEEDEDYFFLMSLLPHLRSIPQHHKLQTRIKLRQVLLECLPTASQFSVSSLDSTSVTCGTSSPESRILNNIQNSETDIPQVHIILAPEQEVLSDFLHFKP